MIRYFIIPVVFLLGLSFVTHIWADVDELVLILNSESEYKSGQYPSISGLVTDSEGNPIEGVEIQAGFPSRSILISTNSLGEFAITSPIPTETGNYTVLVSATKDALFVDAKVSYIVSDNKSVMPLLILPQVLESNEYVQDKRGNSSEITNSELFAPSTRSLSNIIDNTIRQNSPSKVITSQTHLNDNLIIQDNATDKKSKDFSSQKQKIADEISNDLKLLEKENEPNTPRNAFLHFLMDIDSAVKNIFWGQFLFTEKMADKGQEAKNKALDEGKSSKEAMESFQKAAATTRKEIIDHNNKLNIMYGNATSDVQDQFDDNGKLPR